MGGNTLLSAEHYQSVNQRARTTGGSEAFTRTVSKPDARIRQFIQLLEEYRRKCEREGTYEEASKAAWKVRDVKEKEKVR